MDNTLHKQTTLTGISVKQRSNNVPYSIREHRSRIFTPTEWKKFYDSLKEERQKITFNLLLYTGARINEIRHIARNDFLYNEQRLIIRVVKHRKKNPEPRIIRIKKSLCKQLKKYIEDNELEINDTFNILSTPAANTALKKTAKNIGITDYYMFAVQGLRKTFENWALAIGIDSMVISKRVGHNLITSYQHYSQSDAFTFAEKDDIRKLLEDTFI
jgi:integrase